MRFGRAAIVSVGVVSASEPRFRGGLVKPHLQSLIQSVAKVRAQEFEAYEDTKFGNDEFCQPASTFTKKDPTSDDLEYMNDLKKSAQHALSDTRKFLQTMEYDTKQDDYRRAQDMRNAWEATVAVEVKAIAEVLGKHVTSLGEEAGHAEKLKEMANKNADKAPPAVLPADDKGEYKQTPDQVSAAGLAASGTSHGNTGDGWGKIVTYNNEAKTLAETVQRDLNEILVAASKVFDDHLTEIRTKGGEYQLRWPSDFDAEKFKELMENSDRTGETDESGASGLVHTYKQLSEGAPAANGQNPPEGGSSTGDHVDSFIENAEMGNALMELLKGATPLTLASIAGDSASPSEKMDKLTTLLNVLQIRRLGLQDARKSLVDLMKLIQPEMAQITTKVTGLVGDISGKLTTIHTDVYGVYKDAMTFVGKDVFETDTATEGGIPNDYSYESVLGQLKTAEEGDLHLSMKPRAKYIVNAVRQMHAHLLSLVAAHQNLPEKYTAAGEEASIKTTILGAAKTVEDSTAAEKKFTLPEEATKLNADLAENLKNARRTALCILYGRVDGLQNLAKLETDGLKKDKTPSPENPNSEGEVAGVGEYCKSSHAYGIAVIQASVPTVEAGTPSNVADQERNDTNP